MSSENSTIVFGRFKLEERSRVLFKDGLEQAIEPKAIDVLVYLIRHRDRYVHLNELHEQVWAGRIVTDTAVRRTVSKLRSALDDDTYEPVFIKSMPKRGYKFIASLSGEQADTSSVTLSEPTSTDTTQIQESSLPIDELPSSPEVPAARRKDIRPALGGIAALVLLACIVTVIRWLYPDQVDVKLELVETFPSEKNAFALSKDGRYLAFTARQSVEIGYQIFVKDLLDQSVRQVTFEADKITSLAFVREGSELVYVTKTITGSSLKLATLDDEQNSSVTTIYKGNGFIASIQPDRNQDVVYLPMATPETHSGAIFKIDLAERKLTPVSFSDRGNTLDYQVAPSPDSSKIAYVRGGPTREHLSHIQLVTSKDVSFVKEFTWPDFVFDIDWAGESHLLVLDSRKVSLVNIETGEQQKVLDNPYKNYRRLESSGTDGFLLLEWPVPRFQLVTIDTSDLSVIDIESMPEHVTYIVPSVLPSRRFLTKFQESSFALQIQDTQSGEITDLVPEVEHGLTILDETTDGRYLLVSNAEVLNVVEVETGEVIPVTNKLQYAEHGAFSLDNQGVYYSGLMSGNWVISYFDMASLTHQIALPGYTGIWSGSDDYLLWDENGTVQRAEEQLTSMQDTGIEVNLFLSLGAKSKGEAIFWSSYDDPKRITLSKLDYASNKTITRSDFENNMSSWLYPHPHDDVLYVRAQALTDVNVYHVNIEKLLRN